MHDRVNSTHNSPKLPQKANERMEMSHYAPPIEPLFDSFWHTRELALLFGAAGTGKSMLAMLLAERIARGSGIEGFMMPERRRKVLYVDLKLSDTQFGLRYSDPETERDYEFSDDLFIDRPPSVDQLVPWLRDMIAAGIGVIIIDDLSAVQNTADGTKHTLRLMRNLRELVYEHGVSILVIAGSRPHRYDRCVAESDLKRSQILCDVADTVFGIGNHPHYTGSQYVQQTRSRTTPIYWDDTAPPRFTIHRSEDGFVGPKFDERFDERLDEDEARLIYQIKELHDKGLSLRDIAADLNTSKSRVERLLKKWTPDLGRYFDELLDESDADDVDDEPAEADDSDDQHDDAPETAEPQETAPDFDAPADEPITTEEIDDPPPGSSTPISQVPTDTLRHSFDADGHDIWVEKTLRDGSPKVWYEYDSKQRLCRREDKGFYVGMTRKGPVVEAAEVEIARLRSGKNSAPDQAGLTDL